jgi:hypothetical protein
MEVNRARQPFCPRCGWISGFREREAALYDLPEKRRDMKSRGVVKHDLLLILPRPTSFGSQAFLDPSCRRDTLPDSRGVHRLFLNAGSQRSRPSGRDTHFLSF